MPHNPIGLAPRGPSTSRSAAVPLAHLLRGPAPTARRLAHGMPLGRLALLLPPRHPGTVRGVALSSLPKRQGGAVGLAWAPGMPLPGGLWEGGRLGRSTGTKDALEASNPEAAAISFFLEWERTTPSTLLSCAAEGAARRCRDADAAKCDHQAAGPFEYCFCFYQAQRSGKLPRSYRHSG